MIYSEDDYVNVCANHNLEPFDKGSVMRSYADPITDDNLIVHIFPLSTGHLPCIVIDGRSTTVRSPQELNNIITIYIVMNR